MNLQGCPCVCASTYDMQAFGCVVRARRVGSARARAPKASRQHLWGARARTQTQTSDEDRPKCAALTLERTQDQAPLKGQRNPAFSRTYNHTDQCFFKPQLFHRPPAKTKHQHIPEFFQAPAEGISRGPCKHTLLLPRLQHNSLVAPQYTIFPDSLQGISKQPAKYTGAPVQFVSNPHPHRPQLFQTHFKEYPRNLQDTQVLLHSASKA